MENAVDVDEFIDFTEIKSPNLDKATQSLNNSTENIERLKNLSGTEHSLMEEVLKYRPEYIKKQVRSLVDICGIHPEDPLFLILLACQIDTILVENAPTELEKSFDNGRREIVRVLEEYIQKLQQAQSKHLEEHRQAALDISVARLNMALARILEDNGIESKKGKFTPRVVGGIVTAIVGALCLMVGSVAGWSFETAILNKQNKVNLSAAEMAILDWAKSSEGAFAKRILDWNEDLVNRQCEKQVRNLNVGFKIGESFATSGYCFVWIVPPEKRTFE